MKRVGCVLLALAPLATAAVFLLGPDPEADRIPGESGPSSSAAADGAAKTGRDGGPDDADRETEVRIAMLSAARGAGRARMGGGARGAGGGAHTRR
ncbi:hypothetical protein ACFV3O_09155, partial [Streptomyces albidoflavus]